MATWKIPGRSGLRQLNLNDTAGELWSSWNIDLHTNPGKIKLGRPLENIVSDTDLDSEAVRAITASGSSIDLLTDTVLYRYNLATTSNRFTETSSDPSSATDAVYFGGQLVISNDTDIDAYGNTGSLNEFTADWWTDRGNPALTSSESHILEVLRIGQETLAVTDGNKVHAYTGEVLSGTGTSVTVEFDSIFTTTCMKPTNRRVYVGTYTQSGDQAYVFEWDGSSTNYTQSYPIGAKAVLAMLIVDDVPVIVTERGEIKKFNNAGFVTVAQLPFSSKLSFLEGVTAGLIQGNDIARPIHPKGMTRAGNSVFLFLNSTALDEDLPVDERTPSGIWTLNLSTFSMSHLCSPGNEARVARSGPILYVDRGTQGLIEGGRLYVATTLDNGDVGVWKEDISDDTEHFGYFVTPELQVESVKDTFKEVVIKALLGADDSINVKYRTVTDTALPVIAEDVAWTSATQFNTTEDLSAIKTRFDAGESDEIEVLTGQGAGRLAHITNMDKSSTTYSVTIDETIGQSGETSNVRFDNWKKIPKDYIQTGGEVMRFGIGKPGTWLQVKVEIRGKAGRPEIRELIVKSNNKESL